MRPRDTGSWDEQGIYPADTQSNLCFQGGIASQNARLRVLRSCTSATFCLKQVQTGAQDWRAAVQLLGGCASPSSPKFGVETWATE